MPVVKKTLMIDAPLETIHDYAINPENWSHYQSGMLKPEEIIGKGEVGTRARYKHVIVGMSVPYTAEVIESHPDMAKARITVKGEDTVIYETIRGVPKDNGTEVTIEYEYNIAEGGVIKRFSNMIIAKIMENDVAHTIENLKVNVEALK